MPSSFPSDSPAATSADERFSLLKLDYERTLGFADGLVRTRTTIRGIAVTAYLTFIGLAFQQDGGAFAGVAIAAAVLFAWYDLYQGWLYDELVKRANRVERIFQHRLDALDRPYDPYPARRLRDELDRYEFGPLGRLPRFHPSNLKQMISLWSGLLYAVPVIVGSIVIPVV